ncbi:unnamed protein product [Protopolystoma xenopodis]|uniref:Uncharacterized protein n=1 Tax=Protopolystoma xenopodis TaxID=117903 RepID=A0A3S5FFB9_9PLAT|nr:unnamed protein product [Protopolystoma xenopodis]
MWRVKQFAQFEAGHEPTDSVPTPAPLAATCVGHDSCQPWREMSPSDMAQLVVNVGCELGQEVERDDRNGMGWVGMTR